MLTHCPQDYLHATARQGVAQRVRVTSVLVSQPGVDQLPGFFLDVPEPVVVEPRTGTIPGIYGVYEEVGRRCWTIRRCLLPAAEHPAVPVDARKVLPGGVSGERWRHPGRNRAITLIP